MAAMRREIRVLENFKHPNIIRMLGYCLPNDALDSAVGIKSSSGHEFQSMRRLCLVYELAVQGGLDSHLRVDEKAASLSWCLRLCILVEVSTRIIFRSCERVVWL